MGPASVRWYLFVAACVLAACDGDVDGARQPSSGAGGEAGGSADGGGGTGEVAASTGAGGSEPEPEWTVWPGQTWASAPCNDQGLKDLLVELWPSAESECVFSPSVIDVSVLGIRDWDGTPGTFVFGEDTEHGTAGGSVSIDIEQPEGWLTIEPYRDTPGWIEWEMAGMPGRTDLSVCGQWRSFACAEP